MASTAIKNWDNKTWLSSQEYISEFNNFKMEKTDKSRLNFMNRTIDD